MHPLLFAASVFLPWAQVAAEQVQKPLPPFLDTASSGRELGPQKGGRKLKGRFLHITDIHPDPFYKIYSSTQAGSACHRGEGPAGFYGAETSDCDGPISLVNATFKWIDDNLKDSVDFVIWTGDSARHDNDEGIPRTDEQVLGLNKMLVGKFKEVFKERHKHSPNKAFEIPIIPSFGNNDILPHNIFTKGPNKWTKAYAEVWRDIIPEEQRHGFDRGGWYYVEVIPNKLAVFSLNTLYFFDSNNAVDGCASRSEPGYEHMEWLRIQLEFLRQRGMKAILSGHVPPARNDEKVGWDETCWQKYTIWMQQYRDVVVGAVYGHMNIEHFVLQDFRDIDYKTAEASETSKGAKRHERDDDIEIKMTAPDYINSLRSMWSKLPIVPTSFTNGTKEDKSKSSKEQKFYDRIGGQFAERFSVSLVAASVVPNYFPSLRVIEYNITGLEDMVIDVPSSSSTPAPWTTEADDIDDQAPPEMTELKRRTAGTAPSRKKKTPHFTIPPPPSKRAPPGPAYSPQTLSWLGYTNYFANLTYTNNDFTFSSVDSAEVEDVDTDERTNRPLAPTRWRDGMHSGKRPKRPHPHPRNLTYEVEYSTAQEDDPYGLQAGLAVKEWVKLAARIGEWKPKWGYAGAEESEGEEYGDTADEDGDSDEEDQDEDSDDEDESDSADDDDDDDAKATLDPTRPKTTAPPPLTSATTKKHNKKKKKPKKPKKRKAHKALISRAWFAFASRAVVGTLDGEELRERFG